MVNLEGEYFIVNQDVKCNATDEFGNDFMMSLREGQMVSGLWVESDLPPVICVEVDYCRVSVPAQYVDSLKNQ